MKPKHLALIASTLTVGIPASLLGQSSLSQLLDNSTTIAAEAQEKETKKPERKKKKKPAPKEKGLPPGVLTPMNPESVAFEAKAAPAKLSVNKDDSIVIIGSGMASRMNHFSHFETELFLRFPDKNLTIRNMGDEGNTPAFRPHPGRNQEQQYAFPGAKELLPTELQANSKPSGHFETPDQWLTRIGADTVIAFFGYNSSFGGPSDLDRYKTELKAFIQHTLSQKYNGKSVPQLALVSPTTIQDITAKFSVPAPSASNANLKLYTDATKEVAEANGALFVDTFTPSKDWSSDLTIDGALLNNAGYAKLAPVLANGIFGEGKAPEDKRSAVHAAVKEKNFMWLNDFKMPNGVHVFGRRYNPYGPANYPFEIKKTRQMTKNRDMIAFDNRGRLWVATMESYPHYKVGDARPKDKLLIFEDTDNDGVADKQTVFADDLHIPIGFEISHDGVYVSQSGSLVRLQDTDGDDKYDVSELLLSGFDDHDTHHAISAFCADPSGAIVMGEGVFLHSNTESVRGPERGTNGGFWRYSPQQKHILRYSQYSIPNPWGVAFDDYGQDFFLHTSGTSMSWMLPGTVKTRYGANMKARDLLTGNKVRPTSGIEFVSSRHFPDEVQGDVIINNNIGYLGAKQHKVIEQDTGFTTEYVQDLFVSEDLNFRPVDLEFAPDGSLYVADWQNALIGHMQHNARDPLRDHNHGRIYRVTYPSRPLVKPAKIDGASIDELLSNLALPEYRTRYRTRRELRERDASAVASAANKWAASQNDDRLKLEALFVTWGADRVDNKLLKELLASKDHRVRAAAVRVLRFNTHAVPDYIALTEAAAGDKNGRVRLEAINLASFFDKTNGLRIVEKAKAAGVEKDFEDVYKYSVATLNNAAAIEEVHRKEPKGILKQDDKVVVAQVNCVIEGIKFDVQTLEIPVGKKLELIFKNPDVMQHNLIIVKPGTADKVANLAIALGADGFNKQFVPESSDILLASKLLGSGERQTLEFTFDKPGKYPFVCTFPGHSTMMRGHIIVK